MRGADKYRVTVIGPDDEVLDVIGLDGLDMNRKHEQDYIGGRVADGMGSKHREACAALPAIPEDN